MASKKAAGDAPRAILLRCRAVPNYATVNESEDELSSLMERIERLNKDDHKTLSSALHEQDLSEEAVLLHSLFSKFCHPRPSVASVLDILLLERQRLVSLEDKDTDGDALLRSVEEARNIIQNLAQLDKQLPSFMQPVLPTEVLIHTSSAAAQSIITILTSSAKSYLLKLPLHFQLAFYRILIRLLSDETDEDYDVECLFTSADALMEDGEDQDIAADEHVDSLSGDNNNSNEKEDSSTLSDDDTYDIINTQSITFNRLKSSRFDRLNKSANSASKLLRSNTNNSTGSFLQYMANNNDATNSVAYKAWDYARWKKKKSSPLYNIVRFCSNQEWGGEFGDGYSVSGLKSRRSKSWDYVADHVKLGDNEEEEDEDSSEEEDDEELMNDTVGDVVANLINVYNAILSKCSLGEDANDNVKHLMLGPVAHLIGLVSSTGVSVKSLRQLLELAETPSDNDGDVPSKGRPPSTPARLHILRALRYAAEYSNQLNAAHDKNGPKTFFSFGDGGPGLVDTSLRPWPFKHDFGMACWFRVESFVPLSLKRRSDVAAAVRTSKDPNPVLFSAEIPDNGTRIEISFDTSAFDDSTSNAATLIVTAVDARHDSSVPNTLRKIRLVGCVLSPQVWYHVAVRLSRSRMNRFSLTTPFTSKDELSIFLNGKLVLKESMKMPEFSVPSNTGGSKLAKIGSGFSSFQKSMSTNTNSQPLRSSFFSNIEGQAGALYVFEERVSDETIRALYHETANHIGQSDISDRFRSLGSDNWDLDERKMCHLAKVMSTSSLEAELKDVVLPDFPQLFGDISQNCRTFIDSLEDGDADGIPTELSWANFGSKLCIVWDPRRIQDREVFDPHSRKSVEVGTKVSQWSFESVKDTIGSLGGVQRLLPLFWFPHSIVPDMATGVNDSHSNMMSHSLLFLLASFIREHDINCRELFRCGGIHIIEHVLSESKSECEKSKGGCYRLGLTPGIAKYITSALLDLWHASRSIFALEMVIFSRLLFNLPLFFGSVSTCSGISLHATLLPVLSELVMQNPERVRDCIGTRELLDLVTEYSSIEIESNAEKKPSHKPLFYRNASTAKDPLNLSERIFVVDVIFGMIAAILSERCTTDDINPIITFITFNLDLEWEAASESVKSESTPMSNQKTSMYEISLKAVSIFFFLLQKEPLVSNLIEALTDIFEHGKGVASWMLCCLVNSFDDRIRGLGIKCLTAYLQSASSMTSYNTVRNLPSSNNSSNTPSKKITNTMRYGMGIANNVLMNVLSGRDNANITYKLLWHLLKCHRERLDVATNAALLYLVVENRGTSSYDIEDIIIADGEAVGASRIHYTSLLDNQLSKGGTFSIENSYGVGTLFRLLRFMSNDQKERWLFDLLAMTLASSKSVETILKCDNEWQPCLFQLTGEVIDEITGGSKKVSVSDEEMSAAVNTESLSKPSVRTRYDLSLKLYSTLLGHCVRKGDDKAFEAVEMAASLQRMDANGSEVFSILLSHLFAELIENGTIANVESTFTKSDTNPIVKNRALKQSAKLVTQAIISNGSSGLDMSSAVRQWRCLRHLTALTVAVVTDNGFGVVDLFDYRNQNASAIDSITGGMYGIRLDNLVSGINAFEALAGAKVNTDQAKNERMRKRARHRYVCVVLASQVLTLLDAFIFPDDLDSTKAASQLHGLSLVRSIEPRLGQSQGTMLVSLMRLSLILLAYLEPSSVRFLQACSRLRCFLHWGLEIIRESVALGGYSIAFHELTAPLDRMVLAIVLHCHRALSRCSAVLAELESSPWDKYFADLESRQKSHRRLFRAILELREIVLAAYRGRNEVLRAALTPQAHNALSHSLEDVASPTNKYQKSSSKEANLRSFLESDWVSNFLDVYILESFEIPEQVANGQIEDKKEGPTHGKEAMLDLISESKAIVKEYSTQLNQPFRAFCEGQRKWAETDVVRDREYEGDLLVKRLSSKHRTDTSEFNKLVAAQFSSASQRMATIERSMKDPWDIFVRWKVSAHTDLLYRRILFSRNYCFSNHANASYELALGRDKEAYRKEVESRQEREKEKEIELALRAAVVPYEESADDDAEEDDDERAGSDGFFGWVEMEAVEDTLDHSNHIEDDEVEGTKDDTEDEPGESDWAEIDTSEMESASDPFDWARRFLWSDGEHPVQHFENVAIVSVQTFVEGVVLLTSHSIYFHQTGDTIDVMTKDKIDANRKVHTQNRRWRLNQMTDVHGRRYMMKAQGLELFFSDMQGLFLKFNGVKERDLFHSKLRSNCKVPLLRSFKSLNPRSVFKKSMLTDLWQRRRISNFQYIMALNLMAGRTFNDICQYPVFPWILNDYQSEELDLNDHTIYRDLSKPVGALNPDRLSMLIERYNDLDGFPEEQKFLYGSHYSSPGVVLHYMLRQEPFTSMHIGLQSGRFDCPDRLFFDLAGCWRSCLTSTSDVKELIPEFFTCPEIFMNTNNFPLGETQDNKSISNVKLPPWAKGSPHEFIRIHRLALESEYVSRNLHHWIDLIFGYKQRGPASSAAHNVFHYYSYEGSVDLDKIEDEIERKAIEGHIQNFGQTPSQLITKLPHPERRAKERKIPAPFESLHAGDLKVHTPAKQFGGPKSSYGAILSLNAIGDSVFVLHTDLTFCSYKLIATKNNTLPVQIKAERCRNVDNGSDIAYTTKNEAQGNRQGNNSIIDNDSFALTMGGSFRAADHGAESSLLLLSCDPFENLVKVHSVESLQLQQSLNGGHRGRINCIQVSEDGALMITGGQDSTCRVWVVEHDTLAKAITDGCVSSLGLNNDEISCAHILFGHVTPITCVAICSKLDVVISGSEDGSICIHNVRSGLFVRSLHVDAKTKEVKDSCARDRSITPQKLVIHMDGLFAVYFNDGTIMVLTINGKCICKADASEKIKTMLVCHESEALITGGELGSVRVWSLHDLQVRCSLNMKKYGPITSLAMTTDPNFLCVGSSNGFLSIVFRNNK